MTVFIPIVDLTYKGSIRVWKKKETPVVVVRLMDLALRNSCKPNKKFYEIVEAGGLHAYLDYDGIIILSTIMPDDQIKKFNPRKYARFINSLLPNYYLSVDGWTYDKKVKISEDELLRTYNETKELIALCPHAKPLGLVKGCADSQIDAHSSWLASLGIKDFVLHAGDFRRNGVKYYMQMAQHFARIIRKKSRLLFLYGFGSQKQLISHSFADGYISNNHFVTADNGMVYDGVNKRKYTRGTFEENMEKNYLQMHKNMLLIKYQTKLSEVNIAKWEVEAIEKEKLVQAAPMTQVMVAVAE